MNNNMDTGQVKAPRLCIMKKEDEGYGFNLHGEKGVTGQYISAVDAGGAADKAGLRYGDRVVEVNGINVEEQRHSEVVQHIRLHPTHAALLVVDPITDKYLRALGRKVTSDMIALISVTELDSSIHNDNEDNETNLPSEHRVLDVAEPSPCVEDLEEKEELSEEKLDESSEYCEDEGTTQDTNFEDSEQQKVVVNETEICVTEEEGDEENPYDYVTQYSKEEASGNLTDENISGGVNEGEDIKEERDMSVEDENETSAEQLPGNLTLNIPPQTSEGGSNSPLSNCPEDPFKIMPPKVAPRPAPKRKDIKQGDWRAKKELFDKL